MGALPRGIGMIFEVGEGGRYGENELVFLDKHISGSYLFGTHVPLLCNYNILR